MSSTDITGIRSGGKVEVERKDKSSDLPKTSSEASSHAVSDSVRLSDTVQQIATLKEELSSIDVIDLDKVEEIRQAISSGSYSIDTQKIAASLMAFERETA